MENLIYLLFGFFALVSLFFIASKIDNLKRKEKKRKIYESTLGKG